MVNHKRQERDLFTHADILHHMSKSLCCVSVILHHCCFVHLHPCPMPHCLSLCSQRRTCVSGRPVRILDMEKVPRSYRKWKMSTSKCKSIQSCRNTALHLLISGDCHSLVCDSEISWLLELPAGSTSTVRRWIKL